MRYETTMVQETSEEENAGRFEVEYSAPLFGVIAGWSPPGSQVNGDYFIDIGLGLSAGAIGTGVAGHPDSFLALIFSRHHGKIIDLLLYPIFSVVIDKWMGEDSGAETLVRGMPTMR